MSWCPWQPHLLATGGGTADRHIRLWNMQSGNCVGAYDTESQVSGWNYTSTCSLYVGLIKVFHKLCLAKM